MLFNSFAFIFLFLPLTWFLYFTLTRYKFFSTAKVSLVLCSLLFYSVWKLSYLPILLVSLFFNFAVGKSLNMGDKLGGAYLKRLLLIVGISCNLALLAYYKYYDFLIENVNAFFSWNLSLLYLTLPLAISFFTFQQIAYLVDCYKGEASEYDFLNYCLFVTFFPQLIAGPIVHHSEMMPQFADTKNASINLDNIGKGIFIFSMGLFKKVILADKFAVWATQGFDVMPSLSFFEAWFTSFSYSFQLYFDFSGYVDMAMGIALLFNIVLPINFNSPYKSKSIQEFWRNWHITLSRFLRDYIYIPLGGNRKGEFRIASNLMITFLLGGIWHGAGWTFIFWGFMHGLALVLCRAWSKLGLRLSSGLAWFLTFNYVNLAWIFFRATSWDDAMKVLGAMFDLSSFVLPAQLASKCGFLSSYGIQFDAWFNGISIQLLPLWLCLGFIITLFVKNSNEQLKLFRFTKRSLLLSLFLFVSAALSLNTLSEFLYFNF